MFFVIIEVVKLISIERPELKTLEWNILNPDYLIWVSMDTLFILFWNRPFLDIVEKNKKARFFKLESSSLFCILILNDAQNFKFIGFIIRDSD